jgi:hypothetical protein
MGEGVDRAKAADVVMEGVGMEVPGIVGLTRAKKVASKLAR